MIHAEFFRYDNNPKDNLVHRLLPPMKPKNFPDGAYEAMSFAPPTKTILRKKE